MKKNNNHTKIKDLTILIPAFNEQNTIYSTLERIKDQMFDGHIKISVVDDRSIDNTATEIERFITENPNTDISLFKNKKRIGKAGIMNQFLPNIKDQYVMILDANIKLSEDALKNLCKRFNDDTGIVFGNLILKKNHYSSITEEEILYWNLETFLKRLQNKTGNVTSPVGGFYILRNDLFENIPSGCLTEDMFILINVLSKGYNSSFAFKAKGYEYTEKSTINELKRKKRILKGGYFILGHLFSHIEQLRFSLSDLISLALNKFLRWLYPLFFFLSLVSAILLYNKKKISTLYLKANGLLFFMTAMEFSINSFLNAILDKKMIRVKIFKKALYFYTLMTSGLLAFTGDKNGQIWEKDSR